MPVGLTYPYLRLDSDVDSLVLRPEVPTAADEVSTRDWNPGFPEFRVIRRNNIGRSGTVNSTELHGGSQVSLSVRLYGENRHVHAQTLRRMCNPANRLSLFIQEPGWSSQRKMDLVPNPLSYNISRISALYLDVSLDFDNPSGLMMSAEEFEVTQSPVTHADGLAFPIQFPISFPIGWTAYAPPLLRVDGDVPAKPVFRFYGLQRDFRVVNGDTGKFVEILGYTVEEGNFVEIDPLNSLTGGPTILLNGDFRNNLYPYLNPRSTWFDLKPGTNFIYGANLGMTDTATLVVRYRDYWM